jgi:hypothetical protein
VAPLVLPLLLWRPLHSPSITEPVAKTLLCDVAGTRLEMARVLLRMWAGVAVAVSVVWAADGADVGMFGKDSTVLTPANMKEQVLDSDLPWVVGFYGTCIIYDPRPTPISLAHALFLSLSLSLSLAQWRRVRGSGTPVNPLV